ncbi:MAG: hypothetical protein KDD89_09120, partial [Anaerolineales bacterium]|nr:hypothetical protein [Anaerolineales bacterium]
MNSIRNAYIYLVCFISVQIVTWATIFLGRNLLGAELDRDLLASQIAVLIIGGPLLLIHWLWAQRLARQDSAERQTLVRALYLYASLTFFLIPFLFQAYTALNDVLYWLFGRLTNEPDPLKTFLETIATMVILGGLFAYHDYVRREDENDAQSPVSHLDLQRLYRWFFSVAGLVVGVNALVSLLNQIWQTVDNRAGGDNQAAILDSVTTLLLALGLWVLFWRWNQRSFEQDKPGERASVLRKLVLYLIVFFAALTAVVTTTILTSNLIQRLLGVNNTIYWDELIPPLVVATAVWVYHTYVLRQDTQVASEGTQQAGLRRLYWYTLAAIGLAAVLTGISGQLSLLIRSITNEVSAIGLREEVSWYLAATIIGLTVWLWPWRNIQRGTQQTNESGLIERRSQIRRLYLFGYLFGATMTILGSGVYLVYRLLTQILGVTSTSSLFSDVAHALAYALLATAVVFYHGWLLRQDQAKTQQWLAKQYAQLQVIMLDHPADAELSQTLATTLHKAIPGLQVALFKLPIDSPTAVAHQAEEQPPTPLATLATADIIIGSWRTL